MAEGNLSLVANRILKLLGPEDIPKFGSHSSVQQELLRGLTKTIAELAPVLVDAEKKSQLDISVRDWVMELEDVLYDVDNLLHDFSTKQVRGDLFSSWLKINIHDQEIKQVSKRLNEIANRKNYFLLEVFSEKEVMKTDQNSGNQSHLDEGFLRNDDKMAIIRTLLQMEYEENVEVLTLLGREGLGKTRLAQDVFDDVEVQRHFELPIWVPVSEKFNVEEILRKILARATSGKAEDLLNYDKLKRLLGESLSQKRYLIVLDDVPNVDSAKWNSLKKVLEVGPKGSKILVTTRSEILADLIKITIRPYQLSDLSKEQSWILFQKVAFGQEQEYKIKDRSYQKRVGVEIGERCAGHPLAIKAMASMLRLESVKQWRIFYRNELSKIGESYKRVPFDFRPSNEIMQLLRLCYDHLPSPLKHCFAYCSLFPKGHEIDVQTLIKLWMAQGFIIEQSQKSLVDVGYEYFLNLLGRYFFQEVERDAMKRVTKCKMHNLMHKLAMSVTGDLCKLLSSSGNYNRNRTLHVSFDFDLSSAEDIAKFDAKKIRSIVFSGQSRRKYRGISVDTIFDKITSRFRFLRALDLHASGIEIVPFSIGKLKLLEYLDLSENEDVTELPNSITELLNLQTLRLSWCLKLNKLPGDFSNLVKLRHLEIDGCNNLTSLPRGICKLSNLKMLSQFVVSEDSSRRNVVLQKLEQLRELITTFQIRNLTLKNLGYKKDLATYLQAVPNEIRSMSLEWGGHEPKSVQEQTPLNIILESDLDELSINGFRGIMLFCPRTHFPRKLVKLSLSNCANCKDLPSVHQLSSLKVLVLDNLTNLEYIFVGDISSARFFSTLKELWLTELPKLQGWWKNRIDQLPPFHHLSKLVIEDCPKLESMPAFPNLEEGLVLDRTSWKLFEVTMNQRTAAQEAPSSSTSPPPPRPLSNLENLCIAGIKDCKADKIKWQALKNLRFLRFDCLQNMQKLPDTLQQVTSLQELHIWRCGIEEIPKWICKLQNLEKLVIRICPLLNELPEEIRSLQALRTLEIEDCSTLLRRCEKGIGADWDKISGIPKTQLGQISRR